MKVACYTLGCKVNSYESELVLNEFKKKGYEIVNFNEQADIYIINTCTVTNTSDAKSRKMIRQAVKRKSDDGVVVVMGCYPQTKAEEVSQIEGVDIIIGNKDKSMIVDYVEEYIKKRAKIKKIYDLNKAEFENMAIDRFINKTRAFVKIQDGCTNYCAYCIIPYARGVVRSKKKEDTLNEITNLVNNGYSEIVLTGIHTGNYGIDLDNYNFSDLLTDILLIKKLKRLRISSIEITEITDSIIDLLKNNNVIADHLHIPLQSGSNKILKLMNRKYDTNYFIDKIKKIRSVRPDISITTDIIVGFPGEEENDFNDTISLINEIKFSDIHVFPYSKEKEQKLLQCQIKSIKNEKERVKIVIELAKKLHKEYIDKFINKILEVIPEVYKMGI